MKNAIVLILLVGLALHGQVADLSNTTIGGKPIVVADPALTTVGSILEVKAPGAVGESKLSCVVGVCTLYDATAVTGVSQLAIRAGAGQAGNSLLQFRNNAGASVGYITLDGSVYSAGGFSDSSASLSYSLTAGFGLRLNNTGIVRWSSTASYGGTADTTISRTSTGLLQVNSGTAGKWGGLQAGSITIQSLATPTGLTVTPTCTGTCASTWGYKVVAYLADGTTSTDATAEVTTAANATTLDGTHYNGISWTAVTGATSYTVFRTTSGGTPATTGKLATCTNITAITCTDNGLVGDGSSEPTVNMTGNLTTSGPVAIGGGSAVKLACYKADGTTLGWATMAAGDISACN